ncbi:MAG: protein kinase [Sandaracinaceae bacterium]|nr:protein kinase [Sandaracinaceae bacterium]
MSSDAGDALVGSTLGNYRIELKLGTGATGVVFRARPAEGTQDVALKVLHDNLGSISALKRRFEREARVLAKLEHPNIVEITDFGVSEAGHTYIAMELLEGRTLEQQLDEAPLPPPRALTVMREVLRGLAFAHERQVVHRDLKPANVFLCGPTGERVKLLDFGLAKMLSDDDVAEDGTLTRRGRIVGTPAYMAPEQITGTGLDVRADVYACGILLYELLADRRPFLSERRSELLRAHLLQPPPPLSEARSELAVDPALEALVMRCLAKAPEARYANGSELLAALDALPPNAAYLRRPTPSSQVRSRAGATSEVISSSERRAVSESISASEPGAKSTPATPPAPLIPPSVIAEVPVISAAALGSGQHPAEPAHAAPAREPTERIESPLDATRGEEPRISTAVLYVLAASLFALAALLWLWLGPS